MQDIGKCVQLQQLNGIIQQNFFLMASLYHYDKLTLPKCEIEKQDDV